MSSKFEKALAAIDAAHAQDPTKTTIAGKQVPYELHYAEECTRFLTQRLPSASETLQLAIRAQHFRRWEWPRSDYPMTKPGYLSWRLNAKKRAAAAVEGICRDAGYSEEDAGRVGALIRKEDLKKDEETQALEDVACLVFLDDQFDKFSEDHDEEKILGILRKTWGKMGEKGRELALELNMEVRSRELVEKALAG